jgi:catechol 2,3-dioxygenase-like lactoylglutathione lyase family enzyme
VKPKISLITLGVSDFARSLAFYRDGLGFESHHYRDGETFAMFNLEGTWLSIYSRDLLAQDIGIPSEGAGFAGVTLAHNVPSRELVDAVHAFALLHGATSIKLPQPATWGGYSGYFADPDGFLWEVAFNPFTDLT